jgi:hypothetical protein
VLGVLVEILGGDPVAGGRGVAGHGQILLEDLIGVAPDAHIRAVGIEGLLTRVLVLAALTTATLPPVLLTLSHITFTRADRL